MSAGRRQSIERALQRQVQTLPDPSSSGSVWPADAIAWPNRVYRPKTGTIYIQPLISACVYTQLGTGPSGYGQWRGTYNVQIRAPLDTGVTTAAALSDALRLVFPRGLQLALDDAGILTIEFSSVGIGAPAGDWWDLPFMAQWFSNQ